MTTYKPFNCRAEEDLIQAGVKIIWHDDAFRTDRKAVVVRRHEREWGVWVDECAGKGEILINENKIKQIEDVQRIWIYHPESESIFIDTLDEYEASSNELCENLGPAVSGGKTELVGILKGLGWDTERIREALQSYKEGAVGCNRRENFKPEEGKKMQEPTYTSGTGPSVKVNSTEPATQPRPAITADMVIAKYIETRDQIEAEKKIYEEKVEKLKEVQAKREQWLSAELLRDTPSSINADMAITEYIVLRDAGSALKAAFDDDKAKLGGTMEKWAAWLSREMGKLGVKSLKSDAGICFTDTKASATVADGELFFNWVHEDWDKRRAFLENRVSKTAVKQRLEDGETPPPGVSYTTIKDVKIRRA